VLLDRVFKPRIDDLMGKPIGEHRAAHAPLYDSCVADHQFAVHQHPGLEQPNQLAHQPLVTDLLA